MVYALLAAAVLCFVIAAAKPSPKIDGWEDRGSRKLNSYEDEEKL